MTVAFVLVFGCFVAAFVILTVLTARWAMRRDRERRLLMKLQIEDLQARVDPKDTPHSTEAP